MEEFLMADNDPGSAKAFKQFEIFFSGFRMSVKMHLYLTGMILIFQLTIIFSLFYYYNSELIRTILEYLWVYFVKAITSLKWPDHFKAGEAISYAVSELKYYGLWSLLVWITYPVTLYVFWRKSREQFKNKYVGGSQLISIADLTKSLKGEPVLFSIGGVPFPVGSDIKHSFIIGRPGTGKTVFLSAVIANLKPMNKGIIYDFKGDYLARSYDPNVDIIFNPLDRRGVKWNIFNEVKTVMDIDGIAHSLIPESSNQDIFWVSAARAVFSGILHYCYKNGRRTNLDIWAVVTSPIVEIAKKLKETEGGESGYVYIQDASSKQALGVMATLMQYVSCFRYMGKETSDFSISDWLENGKGWIFVTNYADIKDTLRPILSLFVDLLGKKLLSMPDDLSRRIYFIVDEFGTLQKLSTVKDLLTLSRSKGGGVWIGVQDVGQIDRLYGPHGRQTLVNACGTSVHFSVADPDTAEFVSKKIGDTRYKYVEEVHSIGVTDFKDGISLQPRDKTERLVMPSDLQNLPDLECFIKLPGHFLVRTKLTYKSYKNNHIPFYLRDGLEIEKMDKISEPITETALLPKQTDEPFGEEMDEKRILTEWMER
jgi:type IV secretory pathway TraG/TraD family ATPase VirD4